MGSRHQLGFWRRCRIYFRRFRMVVWLLVLALVGVLLYLNQVGLPDFVKVPLLENLRARGIDLQFSRLRLRWYEGIVAEDVRFGRADDSVSPHLRVSEIRVRLNGRALRQGQLQIDSLLLRQGQLVWSLSESNRAPRQLSIDHLQTELTFLPNDQWAIENFRANFAGAAFELSGTVYHASAVRDWAWFRPSETAAPTPAGAWQDRLRRLADTLDQIHFPEPPKLQLDVRGDARDLQTFKVRLAIAAPGAQTPWGTFRQGRFSGQVVPAGRSRPAHAELSLDAADAQTLWGSLTNLQLRVHLAAADQGTNLVAGEVSLEAGRIQTEWAAASNARFTGHWLHSLTNPIPLSGDGRFSGDTITTKWAAATQVRLEGQLAHGLTAEVPTVTEAAWGWWTNLQPYQLGWKAHASGLRWAGWRAEELACDGSWQAPALIITNLHARAYGGPLDARASLNVDTRQGGFTLASRIEPHDLGPLLSDAAQRWLQDFSWAVPPRLTAEAAFVLPAWTNQQADWEAEVLPTVQLAGELSFDQGAAYRDLAVSNLHSHFSYSNLCWSLPDLAVTTPQGNLQATPEGNQQTKAFYCRVHSTVDPRQLIPLLDADQRKVFELFSLTEAPWVDAEIWGRLDDPATFGLKASVALTNFVFRGNHFNSVQTALTYTNQLLQFFAPRAVLDTNQTARADGLTVDLKTQILYLTNASGVIAPVIIAQSIGPHIVHILSPYQFDNPVKAKVAGTIPLHGNDGADLRIEVEGGPFHWWKFNLPHITGHVRWYDETVTLTNVVANFYEGSAAGSARFNFGPAVGTDMEFYVNTTNVLLQALMLDLDSRTNHLEGWLNGMLAVTKANTEDWHTIFGYGELTLRDGLIWEIPLFGIFTPPLNSIWPGLGRSRVNAATCSFYITNGVIRSDDLEMKASMMRLKYHGTVDFEERVNARVEAEVLRDFPLVGALVSRVLWPFTKVFEYHLTGTLHDPNAELQPWGRMLQWPFHPFRILKGLLPEDGNARRTNAPPASGTP